MKPEIHVLGLSIKTFGVTFALAFIACWGLVARRVRELGKPVDWSYEVIFAALVGGVVGARAYYLIQNYDRVRPGVVFALYLVLSGLERFLVEFIRRNSEVLAGLTAPQLESLALCAAGLVWLALLARRGGVAALRAAPA